MVEMDMLLEKVGPMPLKCNLIFLLVLATGAPVGIIGVDEKICFVQSSKEVHMGSSFQVYCIFKKVCNKLIHRDKMLLEHHSFNSTTVMMSIRNLTQTTTVTCKCHGDPEPCGADITPGYPPEVPQNLTCVQEGELGNVSCTWKSGWETYIQTTSHLWVQEVPPIKHASVTHHDGTLSASFPILGTQSQISVWVNTSNSLGSTTSAIVSFMLNDIVRPLSPHIRKVECSSRQCHLYANNTQSIQLVEIQYRGDQGNWSTVSLNHTHLTTNWTVTSLNPYSLYTFHVRWKLSPTRGVWSEWSTAKNMTEEEAPAAMVDAWYLEEHKVNKPIQLLWKEPSKSEARGKILGYNVTWVHHNKKLNSTYIEPTSRNYSVPCSSCVVSIVAVNSKGQSPARLINLQHIAPGSFRVYERNVSNYSIALSWQRAVNAQTVKEYVVEWYPAGRKQQLQWMRVDRQLNTTNITGLKPEECYDGAVIRFLSSGTEKSVFSHISTWQSAPQQGPECFTTVKNDTVEVKWMAVPPEKRRGCLTKYSIYLQDLPGGKIKIYSVKPTQRKYTISGLPLGQQYKLWVSAWTEAGEGPKGNERNIATHSGVPSAEKPMALVMSIGVATFLTCLFLLCICQFSSVDRRLSHCCHCLMPSIVPDPANSKWAKECASEKGEMKMQLYLSDSSMSEEEPDTVEVQELPQDELLKGGTTHFNEAHHSQSDPSLKDQKHHIPSSPYQLNPTSSYLKSISHVSSSSDTTQASRSTDITVDYISSHGVLSGDDDEEENTDMFHFLPCPTSPLLDPLISFGGKLTLDAVKIDCSELECT